MKLEETLKALPLDELFALSSENTIQLLELKPGNENEIGISYNQVTVEHIKMAIILKRAENIPLK